tara:strand:- start:114 stop:281 length:168 start_codon:yes stop_codon:yes gene_type:complete
MGDIYKTFIPCHMIISARMRYSSRYSLQFTGLAAGATGGSEEIRFFLKGNYDETI